MSLEHLQTLTFCSCTIYWQVPPEPGQAGEGQAYGGRPGVCLGPAVWQGGGAAARHHPGAGRGHHSHQRE